MTRVLVTGVNGFVGKHLVRELKQRDCDIVGLDHAGPANPEIAALLSDYFICDLTNKNQVAKLPLSQLDGVINLAGLAQVGDSFKQPDLYMKVNVAVLEVIGQVLLQLKSTARLIAVSTGAVYVSDQKLPLTEDSKLVEDGSPYALSKLAMEEVAQKLAADGLDCRVVRPFNHIGPGQAGGFLLPDLYDQLMSASQNRETILVGNLKTRRDYTDVRDVVRAYVDLVLADKLNYGTYNVCSGVSRSGEALLETLEKKLTIKAVGVEVNKKLVRPNDPLNLYGSFARLKQDTGWQPRINLDKTIADFVASKTNSPA